MTANRVTEPSGSQGEIQFGLAGNFDADPDFVFRQATRRLGLGTSDPLYKLHLVGDSMLGDATMSSLVSSGTSIFNMGLSGSLTRLHDGSPYLIAGEGINISTGSNGAITISATVTGTTQVAQQVTQSIQQIIQQTVQLSKFQMTMPQNVSAESLVTVSGAQFDSTQHKPENSEIFVNGQLLVSGTPNAVSSGTADYRLASNNQLSFAFDLLQGDGIVVKYLTDTANVKRKFRIVAPDVVGASELFTLDSDVDFTRTKFLQENSDIYLNGEIMMSGSLIAVQSGSADYVLESSGSLRFSGDIYKGDTITVICTYVR